MTVSSRMPLEFVAVVGVLIVTVAIIEVPRSNMLPPEASALEAQTWRVPPVARTSSTLLPIERDFGRIDPESAEVLESDLAEPSDFHGTSDIGLRRIARLEASINRKCQWLARRRSDLAAAELQLLHAKAGVGPMERALLHSLALPQDTLPEILERRKLLESDKAAVVAGTRTVNRSRYRVKELSRSVVRRQQMIDKMQDQLDLLLAPPVARAH